MTSLRCLKKLLGHIDRTSCQNDKVMLLVSISRADVEQAWRVVMAEEAAENAELKKHTGEAQ